MACQSEDMQFLFHLIMLTNGLWGTGSVYRYDFGGKANKTLI